MPFVGTEVDTSIPAAFARQVECYADRNAIETDRETFTYAELDRLANGIAWRLLSAAGNARRAVAMLCESGPLNIAAWLGVLKTGAPVIPIDPHWPSATIRLIIEQADAVDILVSPAQTALARESAGSGRRITVLADEAVAGVDGAPAMAIAPNDAAVILYTSGSTGRPKGVVDCHRNLLHEVLRLTLGLQLTAGDRQSLLRANCAGAISDICTALMNGATLLPYDVTARGVAGVMPWLTNSQPTIWRSTPSLFRSVLSALPDGVVISSPRIVFLCGEPAAGTDLELFRAHCTNDARLVNCFGATEAATVTLAFFDRSSPLVDGPLPVGRPVTDMDVLLVNHAGETMDCGEIVVRSRYLAHGYFSDAESTARAFSIDPDDARCRRYRTGDFGYRDERGDLIVSGRLTWQREYQGRFVDLALIEAAVRSVPGIEECAAIAGEPSSAERINLYLAADSDIDALAGPLLNALSKILSGIPVAVAVMQQDKLPKTPSGKIDRVRLQTSAQIPVMRFSATAFSLDNTEPPFTKPRTRLERRIEEIWRALLGLEAIGICQSFFALGGQSLQAAQALWQLSVELGVEIPLRKIFESPTIEGLARAAEALLAETAALVEQLETMSEAEVTAALARARGASS